MNKKKKEVDRTIQDISIEPLKNGYEIKVRRRDGTGCYSALLGGYGREERYYERDWDDADVRIMDLLKEQGQLYD